MIAARTVASRSGVRSNGLSSSGDRRATRRWRIEPRVFALRAAGHAAPSSALALRMQEPPDGAENTTPEALLARPRDPADQGQTDAASGRMARARSRGRRSRPGSPDLRRCRRPRGAEWSRRSAPALRRRGWAVGPRPTPRSRRARACARRRRAPDVGRDPEDVGQRLDPGGDDAEHGLRLADQVAVTLLELRPKIDDDDLEPGALGRLQDGVDLDRAEWHLGSEALRGSCGRDSRLTPKRVSTTRPAKVIASGHSNRLSEARDRRRVDPQTEVTGRVRAGGIDEQDPDRLLLAVERLVSSTRPDERGHLDRERRLADAAGERQEAGDLQPADKVRHDRRRFGIRRDVSPRADHMGLGPAGDAAGSSGGASRSWAARGTGGSGIVGPGASISPVSSSPLSCGLSGVSSAASQTRGPRRWRTARTIQR